MAYTPEQLARIFARTDGSCHICHGKNGGPLTLDRYGQLAAAGGWEVEHSVPKALGGTDHGNNLYAAHISCNRSKGDGSTRSARAAYGVTRAPLSTEKKQELRERNTLVGMGGGIAFGAAVAGPPGALFFGLVGLLIGNDAAVE